MRRIKAVFLDRDGTINEEKGYVHRIEDLNLVPGSLEALKSFTKEGIKVYIVTNQAGIARGYYTEEDFRRLTARLLDDLTSQGIRIEEVLYCPHHPEGSVREYAIDCGCRKPNTALIEGVMKKEGLEPRECALVGDKNSDVEAGRRLGMETYLVLTGHGTVHQGETRATYVVRDLASAAAHIIKYATGEVKENDRVDAIILAGGLGTRLKDAAGEVPKALAPVRGGPFLDLILSRLKGWERLRKVVIAAGYRGDQIAGRYGQADYGFEIIILQEKELLGTGGAIKRALKFTSTRRVLALNGDSYVEFDLESLWRDHVGRAADMTMVLTGVDDVTRYGSVTLGEGMKIVGFEEKGRAETDKPGSGLINAGVYLFGRRLFDGVEDRTKLSLEKDLLPAFVKGDCFGYVSTGRFIDIGTPQSYRMADVYLKGVQNG